MILGGDFNVHLGEYLVGNDKKVSKEMIETVTSMGFDKDVAQAALKHFKGDIGKSIDMLTNTPERVAQLMENREEEYQKRKEARERMEEDLGDDEDHLDVSLEEEASYLEQYKKLITMA